MEAFRQGIDEKRRRAMRSRRRTLSPPRVKFDSN
jgi:hypothetical protein